MSWEQVTSMPSSRSAGSPYQGIAEPIVAERTPPTPRERARLFFRSTPELPSRRAAHRVVLTPSHLYAERADHSVQRVRLEALSGRRVDGPQVIYGVAHGEDLALLHRTACPVTRALDARFLATDVSTLEPVVLREGHVVTLVFTVALAAIGMAMLDHYGVERAIALYHRGHIVAETQLGVYAATGALLIALGMALFAPVRWEIDTLGVRRVRGLVPWLPYLDPPDAFVSVCVAPRRVGIQPGGQPVRVVGYAVLLVRSGGVDSRDLLVRYFALGPANELRDVQGEARFFAARIARLMSLEVSERA